MGHWLVLNVAEPALHVVIAGVVGMVVMTPFRSGLQKLWRAVDSVDPDTDTGIIRELREIHKARK